MYMSAHKTIMGRILHKFKLLLPEYLHGVLYAELVGGVYAKTFYIDGNLKVEYITFQEYATALAHIMLRWEDDYPH